MLYDVCMYVCMYVVCMPYVCMYVCHVMSCHVTCHVCAAPHSHLSLARLHVRYRVACYAVTLLVGTESGRETGGAVPFFLVEP